MDFIIWYVSVSNTTSLKFLPLDTIESSSELIQVQLVPCLRQAVTPTNTDPVHRRIDYEVRIWANIGRQWGGFVEYSSTQQLEIKIGFILGCLTVYPHIISRVTCHTYRYHSGWKINIVRLKVRPEHIDRQSPWPTFQMHFWKIRAFWLKSHRNLFLGVWMTNW